MIIVQFIEFIRKHLRTVTWFCFAVLALLVLMDAIPAIVHKEGHAHTGPEKIPGFWAAFGFVACVVIILVSKWFGHRGIMTREDYYDE